MDKKAHHDPEEPAEISGRLFAKRIAFSTMIYAVLLALTSLGGNSATNKRLYAQQQAADQRATYQSQVIGEQLYKTNGLRMEAYLLERGPAMRPNIRKLYGAMLKDMKSEEMKYREGKKKIEAEAIAYEANRDRNRARSPYFDLAGSLLLISIVLASIAVLSVSPRLFYFSIGSAAFGALFMLNGYFLIFRLPFFL
jgi:Domain of unknown function (DUF4337)